MPTTERLIVDLPSDLVATLREAVQRGDFSSESEALSAILRVWQSDGELGDDLGQLREMVAEGLAEADAGQFIDADEVHAELRAQIKAVADRRK
jgi:Arc/MetJ-type ribon-helix-helix transcriptional regulator